MAEARRANVLAGRLAHARPGSHGQIGYSRFPPFHVARCGCASRLIPHHQRREGHTGWLLAWQALHQTPLAALKPRYRRRLRGHRRREQILKRSKAVCREGFRETEPQRRGYPTGIRRQAVYHYFRSKEEILYELIDRAGQAIATSARRTLDADIPRRQALAEVVRNHVPSS